MGNHEVGGRRRWLGARRSEPTPTWEDRAREIGIRLQQRARSAKGMSQEAVAYAAGIAGQTYYKLGKGSPSRAPHSIRAC